MTLLVRDTLGRALVPPNVIFHAICRTASSEQWTLTELSASGNIETLYPGSMQGLIDNLPLTVSWNWIENLVDLVEDVEWLDATGPDVFGGTLRVRCFDSTTWEIVGTLEVEASLMRFFHDATIE